MDPVYKLVKKEMALGIIIDIRSFVRSLWWWCHTIYHIRPDIRYLFESNYTPPQPLIKIKK